MALVQRTGTGPASTAIYVYVAGTLNTLATIFSDGIGTPLANPFTTNLDGTWEYWFDTAVSVGTYNMYDRVSGGGGSGITELTGDVTAGPGSGSQAATIAAGVVTNANLADMTGPTIKGRETGTGAPQDLTPTETTALLDAFVGDSGAGGTKGLVPAPAAGEGALGYVLGADGTWIPQTGSGADPTLTYLTEADETADLPNSLRLVAGTNITFDTSTPNELEISASGSGGGNATTTSAFASPPGSPAAGDVWFPTDSFYLLRYSGSAQIPWGPIFPMAEPSVAGPTTWVNQGTSTIDTTPGGITLVPESVNASNAVRARVKTAPATPYSITAAFIGLAFNGGANATSWGLCWRESGTGELITVGMQLGATGLIRVVSFDWASPTDGAPAVNYVYDNGSWHMPCIWFRITDDGSDRITEISADGQHWMLLSSEGRTTFLTADQVGFFAYQSTTLVPDPIITLLSWQET